MLTRKDFKELAGMLKNLASVVDEKIQDKETAAWIKVEMISEFTSLCWKHNPRFDQERFLKAAGLDDFYCQEVTRS